MNETARAFIAKITQEVEAKRGNGANEDSPRPNPVLNQFFSMAREVRTEPEEGPASEHVIYSAIDLLTVQEDIDKKLVSTSFRLLNVNDKKSAAKMKRGFQTAAIALSLVTSQSRQK